jgi:tellurium resistance protein TerZ
MRQRVLDLPQDLRTIRVGLGWDTGKAHRGGKGKVDLDVSAILVDKDGQLVEAVFFGHKESKEHGIKLSGDSLTGEGDGDDEQIVVKLAAVGRRVTQIFFVINIHTKGMNFENVANPCCRVVDDSTSSEWCKYALRDAGRETGLILAKIEREVGNHWGFHPLGLPSQGRWYKHSWPQIQQALPLR